MKKEIKLGFCPIGKFVFSHEDALRQKAKLEKIMTDYGVTWVGLDEVLPDGDGLVRRQDDVGPVVDFFRGEKIDALFIPHCNFGTEGAAGMIAKECGVPTLLWGPRDGAPLEDGSRLRDSLCGTLATSKVLYSLRVPFSYIVNSHPESDTFSQGFDRFCRAARVVKTIKTMRVGIFGQRVDFFYSTIGSEIDLLQKFGIQLIPYEMALLIDRVLHREREQREAYRKEAEAMASWFDFGSEPGKMLLNFAWRDECLALIEELKLDTLSVQSFFAVPKLFGMSPALGNALLNDLGYPVAPESDIHGAISSAILEAASALEEPSFLPDLTIRHPEHDNAVLLWHADAPLSLRDRKAKERPKVGVPWILKGLPPGLVHFKLKDGPLTVGRFDGDSAGYRLGFGEGKTVPGPYTQEFYAYMEVNNWPRWEEQIIRGPYIHHCSGVYGHCADVLQEATRFLPNLTAEHFGKE